MNRTRVPIDHDRPRIETDSTTSSRSQSNATIGRTKGSTWSYMPALDGIRALAIIGVLIFHGNPAWLPGGYLGVDVFFVLSGFLITSIVLHEIETRGKLDFKNFYVRRARRLLPALFLVLFATAVLALIFAQDAVAQLRQDILASLFYVNNWSSIASDLSYFEAMGRAPMLQHLWSLAVEEQFYLIWPVVVVFAYKWRNRFGVRRVALIGALASTLLMMVLSFLGDMPSGADASRLYFGTDTHAMGLLIGAALASAWSPGRISKRLPAQPKMVLTGIGLGALGLVVLFYMFASESSWFMYRGGFLIFSAITAVLIVASTHPAIKSSRILSVQPLKYIGQRSYGLYLWHWPIFLLLRPGIDIGLDGLAAFALQLSITFALAELSYRFVEMPIRRGAIKNTWKRWNQIDPGFARKRAAIIGASSALVLTVVAAWMISIPAPNSNDYLGGVESVGAEALAPTVESGSGEAPTGEPNAPSAEQGTNGKVAFGPDVDLKTLPVTVLGDSVVLGARSQIETALPKAKIDAAVSRQTHQIASRVDQRISAGSIQPTVVIHTGTNGPAYLDPLRKTLDQLKDSARVVLVTNHGPPKWIEESNQNIATVASEYDNVRIADWAASSKSSTGLTVYDGTHLTPDGGRELARLITEAIKQP